MPLQYLLAPIQNPLLIAYVALGTLLGVYVGAIPGLSGTMAVSLLVSLTFGWDAFTAVSLLIGVFVGAVFGGSRSAILLNIPGAPAAVATGFDGYPLAKKGLAGMAMGVATVQSVLGTVLGILALALCAPFIARFALYFQSVDYLLLALMGMMMVGSLGSKSLLRGVISAGFGIFLGTIGMDPLTAVKRFTFNDPYLNSGVSFIVALIGLFGASEALVQLRDLKTRAVKQKIDKILPSFKQTLKYLPLTLRSGVLGVLIGALPGAGGDLAALLAYDQARRSVKRPETPFGEGAIEGVIAPETANNAAIGGAFIPMLTLGIPGDAVTAVLIGALTMHGLRPGPNLMTDSPELFGLIVSCLALAAVFLLVFGLTGIKAFTKIVEIPKAILLPMILILSVVGAYAINHNVYDIFWMFGFGVIGYLLKRYDYPLGPMVLGVILCNLLETNFIRAVRLSGSTIGGVFARVFQSPLSAALFFLVLFLGISQSAAYKRARGRAR